ncbi:MAG: hypothetical protein Q8L54_14570 [Devosia sp.]|nr:hypothetical protein [Devosia sp.]
MNALEDIKQAAIGWLDLIASRPGGAERFNRSGRGLANAVIFYFLMVLFTIIVQGVSVSFPTYERIFVGLLVNALPLAGVALVVLATVRLLRVQVPVTALMVPAVYALAFLLLIGLPLSLFFGNLFANALMGILGYMLYRAARDIAKLGIGTSIAFAVLAIAVLVALPIGIYMVTMLAIPAS